MNAGRQDPLYKSIESYLSKYRQSIKTDDVVMQNGIVRLALNGRRTNIKFQLLVGFYLLCLISRTIQGPTKPIFFELLRHPKKQKCCRKQQNQHPFSIFSRCCVWGEMLKEFPKKRRKTNWIQIPSVNGPFTMGI